MRAVSVDNPTIFFVTALRDALVANGIDVRGPAVDVDDLTDAPSPAGGVPLVSYRSPPLSTLATTLMKESQNLYAETFLKTMGGLGARRQRARPRSTAAGRRPPRRSSDGACRPRS